MLKGKRTQLHHLHILMSQKEKVTHKPSFPSYITPPPFPNRLAKSKKEEQEKEILDTLGKWT